HYSHYGNKEEQVTPIDFLFLSGALRSFEPDTYDCKTPVRLLDRQIDNPLDLTGPKMRLEIVALPQATMATFAGFSEAERQKIKTYRVGRGNNGFFFYRNGHLILWGDDLAGVQRDDLTFRARLSFTEAHDELLHVDVSRHLTKER
ncbi:MAG: hypothetical protein M3324_07540, partial [Actinomycetota bacterium]|nr:hypothetical protein [Actinomycetota bacterium]